MHGRRALDVVGGRERPGLLRGAHALDEPALRRVDVVLARVPRARLDGDALVGDVHALALQPADGSGLA